MFSRNELLIGEKAQEKLSKSSVALFGVGGVGGFVLEALVRCGVGNITIFDNDTINKSNINRQIIATTKTVGNVKVDEFVKRAKEINPSINIKGERVFYLPENASNYDFSQFNYVIDVVDTITAKLEIIKNAYKNNVKVISCMGTGGKIDSTKLKISTIEKTDTCPLARVMRRELKNLNIKNVKVLYSTEESVKAQLKGDNGKNIIPSMIFVPASAGLMIAKEVVFDLIKG